MRVVSHIELAHRDMEEIENTIICVKTLLEKEGNGGLEKDLIEQVGNILEEIFGDDWWEVGGRICSCKEMLGTGYGVRYDLVKDNNDVRTCAGKGRWY